MPSDPLAIIEARLAQATPPTFCPCELHEAYQTDLAYLLTRLKAAERVCEASNQITLTMQAPKEIKAWSKFADAYTTWQQVKK